MKLGGLKLLSCDSGTKYELDGGRARSPGESGNLEIRNISRNVFLTGSPRIRKYLIDLELGSFYLINLHGVTQGSVPSSGHGRSNT